MKACQTFFLSVIFPWVPKRLLSRTVGLLMRVPLFWPVRRPVLRAFAKAFRIRVEDAERDLGTYRSMDDFFTRRLKAGLRPVQGRWVHPVDGKLTEMGRVTKGELVQAKGWSYSLAEFLGEDVLARRYEGGQYFTYYLCPADYHRVHAPFSGELVSARHIPGLLWPVNAWSVTNIRRLFCLNERVVLNFQSPEGQWTLVFVGATNVGHMTISVDPSIITNRWMWHAPTDRRYVPGIHVGVGDELGAFHLGSTVILLFEKTFPEVAPRPGATRFGERVL